MLLIFFQKSEFSKIWVRLNSDDARFSRLYVMLKNIADTTVLSAYQRSINSISLFMLPFVFFIISGLKWLL